MSKKLRNNLKKYNLSELLCYNCKDTLFVNDYSFHNICKCSRFSFFNETHLIRDRLDIKISLPTDNGRYCVWIYLYGNGKIESSLYHFDGWSETNLLESNSILFSNLSDPIITAQELETILTFL